uniref:Uncharacterized mitochondrial protein AtMg00810-like n=1 Tax=Tanacetum cinerariifolium TaxID=118510 RepID=A0A6L2JLE8_TANCI|nr:uncharacterized mitochondrial protein AtMg00810-like [Tanacetum cinerariifolium]
METLTVEIPIPTVNSPVSTDCLTDSQKPSSDTRLISKRVTNQEKTPSLDNILTLTNRFKDIIGVTTNLDDLNEVEANVSNMETTITSSPTHTLRIHKDHPKSQIISPVDTPIQTRHKSKEVGEQSFIATIHQKTDPALLQFCLFSCFLSQVEPKKIFDALQDLSWVEAMQEELLQFKIQNVCREFEALMHEKFQMSAIGELNFFLGLQVLQKEDGIFISLDKYVGDILKKFGYSDIRSSNTPMDKENPWGKDGTGKDVDLHLYRSMIGSLMYLTASRPDIMFAVCACARHQVTPKKCHLHAVKRIFRYLKDRKSTTEGCQFLGRRLISWQCKKQTIVATSTTEAEYVAAASGCGQVLWIQNQLLDYGLSMPCEALSKEISSSMLRFTDPTGVNMCINLLLGSDSEQRTHESIHVCLASASVYVWIGIETPKEGTKILAIVDGKLRTVSESSIRRNLKLNDEAGISSLPDAELFENLTPMGYNISPNQKFTFQKGKFSRQWKYLIHTIMQCLSPKCIGFNKFSGNIATTLVCLATNRVYNFSKMIFDGMVRNVHNKVSKFLMYPWHYTRRARIAQSSALPSVADEPASPIRDDSQGEACPIDSSLEANQDRANIPKTSTLPSDSTTRVTSLPADEGSIQQKLDELTALCTSLQRQQSEMVSKFAAQELEITNLKARVKLLEDREEGGIAQSGDDALIKGRSGVVQVVPTAAEVATATVSIPTSSEVVFTASPTIPTASPIFTTATESTPYTRRKGKETMVECETPKKKKVQEQIDVQLVRELEEEMARDAQRMNEQIARYAEIERIHTKEELHMLIDGLDRNNKTVAKYLQEYYQFDVELPIERRIELISDMVKYQDHYAKILKYQTQQRKPLSRKQQKEFYMSVLKSHAGWKARHFKGMTLEEIKEKFDLVWKQFQDIIPIGSKEEAERFKRKGHRLEQESVKKLKTSEEVKATEEVPNEKVKEMMQLVPIKEVYVEALQVKHHIINWKVHTKGQRSYWKIIRMGGSSASYQFFVDMLKHFDREDLNQLWVLVKETLGIRPATSDKEKELWVELKRLFEPDVEV